MATFDPNDAYGPHALDTIRFVDGTALTYSQLIDKGFDLTGTSGADTMTGTNAVDRITGLVGNDTLSGGAGDDTYIVNLGDGVDTVHDTSTGTEGNSIRFGAGITVNDLALTEANNILTIAYGAGSDAVKLAEFDRTGVNGSLVAKTLRFADNSTVPLVNLLPGNDAPYVANPIADQTVPEEAPLNYTVPANTFTDPDAGDTLTFSATLANGSPLPGWLTFTPSTRTFTGAPDDAQIGTISLKVTATDTGSLSASDTFDLTVTNVNEAPTVANPIADQGATKDISFNFVVPADAFADEDAGDTLTYGATLQDNSPLPAWLTFTPSTRTFSGTPGTADVGTLNVKVTATDTTTLSISDIFALTVASGLNEIVGTSGNDNITGTTGNDHIQGLAGIDFLDGLEGNDFLEGGDGDDILVGRAGNDTIDGGAGNDRMDAGLPGGTDTNVLIGGTGNDILNGFNGNETFIGGPGNDSISDDYGGQDVILFNLGDGQDSFPRHGTVRFGPGILPADVTVRGNSDLSMIMSINGTTDKMSMFGWMNPFQLTRIDRVEFANGTVWDNATLQAMASAPTAGDDYIGGTNGNDVLAGAGGNDIVEGWNGDDVLDGGTGNDTLKDIFNGNDTYIFGRGYGADVIEEGGSGTDTIELTAGVLTGDVTILQNGTQRILSIDQSATQIKFTSIEQIRFNDGTLWNAAAITSHTITGTVNSMTGTSGNDTFVVDNTQDTVTEAANQGTDTIQSMVSYTLPVNVENLTLTGYFSVDGTGNDGSDNVIIGNSGNNKLAGSVNDYWGGGVDTLQGGAGDDTYTVIANDPIIEAPNQGIDSITFIGDAQRGWNYSIPDNVENMTAIGASWVFPGTDRNFFGNALNNIIKGDPDWFNYIDGGPGADTMIGGTTSFRDTYVVDDPGDVIVETGFSQNDTVMSSFSYTLAANLENLTLTGTAPINGTGNDSNNVLTGNSAANVLTGGPGDDTYVVDAADTIVENAGEGTDTVQASQTWVLAAALENLTLIGSSAINGTGNALDNVLTGNTGDNVLDGGAGADQLVGGAGNDTYLIDATDTVVEQAGQGLDTIVTDQSYTLPDNLENITLTGTAAINATGNASDNVLTGNSGANVLTGGAGNDTYVADDSDTLVENAGEGTDTVQSSVTRTLASNLENLTLIGTNAINGTGNAVANVLTGNSAANVLTGGGGDDTYVVDGADTVVEAANEGIDTVQSSGTYTLGANVEHLTLTGTANINGTGNGQNNTITGNSGANVLDGGGGADAMSGVAGTTPMSWTTPETR